MSSKIVPSPDAFKYAQAANSLEKFMVLDGRGKWEPALFHKIICRKIEEVEASTRQGIGRRVMIFVPPQHGKSEICTKKAPAWLLGRNPDWGLIESSYGADLIEGFSRIARDTFEEWAPKLWDLEIDPSSKSVKSWGIKGHRGGNVAAGVGGAITGKPAKIFFIDDPHKNREEANSQVKRDMVWGWYKNVVRTRLGPGASVILIMTRWHQDDLAGRLLEKMDQDETGDLIPWEVISFPAFAEENDPLGREEGETLWPERYSEADYLDAKATLLQDFTALYQQRPQPTGGAIFQRAWFKYFREDADYYLLHSYDNRFKKFKKSDCWKFQTVDTAASEKQTADFFVLCTWIVTPNTDLLLDDVRRERAESTRHKQIMWGEFDKHFPQFQAVENITFGMVLIQDCRREGLPVKAVKVDRDKVSRARMAAARYESGSIYHRANAPWLSDFEGELLIFPSGKNDDQVDNVSMAVAEVVSGRRIFGEFNREKHIKIYEIDEEEDLFLRGWVTGYEHSACVVAQIDAEDNICLIDSFYKSNMVQDDFVEQAKEWSLKYGKDFRDFISADSFRQVKGSIVTESQYIAGQDVRPDGLAMRPSDFVRMTRILLQGKPHLLYIDFEAGDLIKTFESGLTFEEKVNYNMTGEPEKNYPWFSIWEALKQIVAGVFNPTTLEPMNAYRCKAVRGEIKKKRRRKIKETKEQWQAAWTTQRSKSSKRTR